MKILLIIATLTCSLQATPYLFTLKGTTDFAPAGSALAGTTFTTQFLIDTSVADTDADPAIGSFTQGGASSVTFSNGFQLSGGAFDYVVFNDLFIPPLGTSYDGIAFYFYPSGLTLGFELRLPLDTFSNAAAQVPTGSIPLNNQDWFYITSVGLAGGSITSIEVATVAVPETGSTATSVAVAFALLFLGQAERVRLRLP